MSLTFVLQVVHDSEFVNIAIFYVDDIPDVGRSGSGHYSLHWVCVRVALVNRAESYYFIKFKIRKLSLDLDNLIDIVINWRSN